MAHKLLSFDSIIIFARIDIQPTKRVNNRGIIDLLHNMIHRIPCLLMLNKCFSQNMVGFVSRLRCSLSLSLSVCYQGKDVRVRDDNAQHCSRQVFLHENIGVSSSLVKIRSSDFTEMKKENTFTFGTMTVNEDRGIFTASFLLGFICIACILINSNFNLISVQVNQNAESTNSLNFISQNFQN